MSRCKVLVLNSAVLVNLLRPGTRTVASEVPADAIVVGPPVVTMGSVKLLLRSESFPETPEGQRYPMIDARVTRHQ